MLYCQPGTGVGVAQTVQFGAGSPPAQYVEVHNLSPANTFQCLVGNVTFPIPPLRKLVLTVPLSQVILTGTGDWLVIGNSEPQEQSSGPSLQPTFYGTGGSSTNSPADNLTIQDTGLVLQVKDLGISTAKLANLAVDNGKLANLAVNTSKLADLAGTFNKTGSGLNQNPGRGAACAFNSGGVAPGDTLTVTFLGVPVVYEFTNGGAPAPGNIGVDIPTINVDLPAKVLANQPLVSCSGLLGIFWLGVSIQSLIQSGATLTIVSSIPASCEDFAPVAESRIGLEWHQFTITAANAVTGYPIFTSGTIVAKWFIETVPGGSQLSTVGIGFQPITDGIVVSGSGAVGNLMNVLLAVQY